MTTWKTTTAWATALVLTAGTGTGIMLAQTEKQTPAPAKPKAQPITVKKQESLPPDAVRERKKFYEDSADIEEGIWRSIYG